MPHILVVDDDADLLELMTMVLEKSKYNVTSLDNGNDLENIVDAKKPDLLLMDIYLGNTDGRELCRNLKTNQQLTNIPVILYSAGNIPSQTIRDSKADAFIAKPFSNEELVEKIQSLVQK